MLWMLQRMTQGPLTNQENRRLRDLNPRELCTILPLVGLMFWIGLAPNWTLSYFDKAVTRMVVEPIVMARSRTEGGAGPAGPAFPGMGMPGIGRPGTSPGGSPPVPRPAPVPPPGSTSGPSPFGGLESPPAPPPPPAAGGGTAPGGTP
jgi:hypothetical protein